MSAAITRNSGHNWLPRPVQIAAATAAAIFFFLGGSQQAGGQTFTIVHNFAGPDGARPTASLDRDTSGNLYGTTGLGGSAGHGTVFKIDAMGNESVIHSFNGADGDYPFSGLVEDASGNLYGTTAFGGPSFQTNGGVGTVFKIDAAGNFSVLHNFTPDGSDGEYPYAGLIRAASGNLYGTTFAGGSTGGYSNFGTVFKVDSSGNESVLYTFSGADGLAPWAGLVIDAVGNLYGTTQYGGPGGMGNVFKIDTAGKATVLHFFTGGADGVYPQGSLTLDTSGNLYGTTSGGGESGHGTIFKIDAATMETVLHSFNVSDGADPMAGLVSDAAGNFYGTTIFGGDAGYGTVFKVDAVGDETVLHSFNGTDGANPLAPLLLDSSHNLYGTTEFGGSANAGTVFKIALSVTFESFNARLDIAAGGFQLQAFFTQGTVAPAINPVAQGMTLTIGTYTVTIPPGAFLQTKKGWFVYGGMIDGVALQVRISQTGANSYELQAEGSGPSFTSMTKPVTVALTLGNNNGTTVVNQ